MIGPLADVDGTKFVSTSSALQVTTVALDVSTDPIGRDASLWWVDVEITVRNVSVGPVVGELAILDEPATTGDTLVWVDGEPARTDVIVPRQDPTAPEHSYAHARLLRLDLLLGGEAVVRARMRRTGLVDTLGRVHLELPTHALGLFAATVGTGQVRVNTGECSVGFVATLEDGTTYGEPLRESTWRIHEWEPRIPFGLSFSTPWSALLLVAEVEACPAPWDVVRATTRGEIAALRDQLARFDDATLRFCGNLPDVLRGRPFESERTVEQLTAMTLDRYVAGAPTLPLYRPDPAWSEAEMTEAEAIYGRALRGVLSERAPTEP